jgi:hypothetical protein
LEASIASWATDFQAANGRDPTDEDLPALQALQSNLALAKREILAFLLQVRLFV